MLSKGEKIFFKDFHYELLSNPEEKEKMKDKLYTAKAKRVSKSGESEIRFIKFVSAKESTLMKYLNKESSFSMYFPYIERIYGSAVGKDEEDRELFVLEAEFLEGENLTDALVLDHIREEEYDKRIFSYFLQMLYAGKYYSRCSMGKDRYLHRDIKPDNIMLVESQDGIYAMLVDFDLAHIVGSRSTDDMVDAKVGRIGGTKGYIDPRAWGPYRSDIQMDIYSMGRTFCYCLLSKEWRSEGSNTEGYYPNEYYTEEENQSIYDKMHGLFSMKKVPDEQDTSYYTKDWMKLAYGLDMKRLDKKYAKAEYAPLIEIIKNMVAPTWARYGDFDTILCAMKDFLKGFYGEEAFDSMKMCDLLLEKKEEDSKEELSVTFWCDYPKGNGKDIRSHGCEYCVLENYGIRDIWLGGTNIAVLYNHNGQLFFISYGKDVKTSGNQRNGKVVSGDAFYYNNLSVEIKVNDE